MGVLFFSSDYGQIAHGCWFSLRSLTDFLKKKENTELSLTTDVHFRQILMLVDPQTPYARSTFIPNT